MVKDQQREKITRIFSLFIYICQFPEIYKDIQCIVQVDIVIHGASNNNEDPTPKACRVNSFWSEQSEWDQRSNLGRPLFLIN